MNKLKQKIIETVPEIWHWDGKNPVVQMREIRLADILLTINKEYHGEDLKIDINWASDTLVFIHKGNEAWWNLKEDFDNQSKETIKFLEDILI